jgi:hypothetical protein
VDDGSYVSRLLLCQDKLTYQLHLTDVSKVLEHLVYASELL